MIKQVRKLFWQVGKLFWQAGEKFFLAGGKMILAGGKIFLAGGKIILEGQVGKSFWQVGKLLKLLLPEIIKNYVLLQILKFCKQLLSLRKLLLDFCGPRKAANFCH